MSVNVRIKQKSLFKKKLNAEDVIALSGLAYGVSDENYRLIPDEIGETHTLLYDETHLARGIDLSMEGTDIVLQLSLPTAREEIRRFYQLIAQICRKIGTKTYIRDEETVSLGENDHFIACDEQGSVSGLEMIADSLRQDSEYLLIFGIMHPLSIGAKEIERFGNRLDDFAQFLQELQSADLYYAAPQVFRMSDQRLIGIYTIPPDVPSIVPTTPHVVLDQIQGVEHWYLLYEGDMVTYADFLRFAQPQSDYDANRVVVQLSQDQLSELVAQYRV